METRYRAAIEGMPDAFYLMDAIRDVRGTVTDFTIVECNEQAARRSRRSRSELLGTRYSKAYPDIDTATMIARFAAVMLTGKAHVAEYPVDRPGLDVRFVKIRVTPLPDGVAITSADITHQQLLSEERDGFF